MNYKFEFGIVPTAQVLFERRMETNDYAWLVLDINYTQISINSWHRERG